MMVARLAIAMLLMVALVGCAADSQTATGNANRGSAKRSAQRWNSNTDPCAMRLHDACAPLLLYFGRYHTLPPQIEEVAQVPGATVPELACPASGKKYIYNPQGPLGLEAGTRLILYDATPAHAGRRWAIVIRDPTPGQALVVNVIAVPESVFGKRP